MLVSTLFQSPHAARSSTVDANAYRAARHNVLLMGSLPASTADFCLSRCPMRVGFAMLRCWSAGSSTCQSFGEEEEAKSLGSTRSACGSIAIFASTLIGVLGVTCVGHRAGGVWSSRTGIAPSWGRNYKAPARVHVQGQYLLLVDDIAHCVVHGDTIGILLTAILGVLFFIFIFAAVNMKG